MPPMSLFLMMIAAWAMRRRWPRSARIVGVGAFTTLLVLSTNAGARLLVAPLENLTAPLVLKDAQGVQGAQDLQGAQAIILLAAGSIENAPDYDGADIPDEIALVRMRYAARLQHVTGLPLLITGGNGSPDGSVQPKARGMAQALTSDFRTPVRWVEDRSANTSENAEFSAPFLRRAGVTRILLVTHAMHMARAQRAFERQGLQVIAAPTRFYSHGKLTPLMFMPSPGAMFQSAYAVHEWIGLAWYRLK